MTPEEIDARINALSKSRFRKMSNELIEELEKIPERLAYIMGQMDRVNDGDLILMLKGQRDELNRIINKINQELN